MQEDTTQYVQQHGLEGFIRISNDEYAGIPQGGWLAHFNLEQTTVKAGHTYALPRILKHGYLDPQPSFEHRRAFSPQCQSHTAQNCTSECRIVVSCHTLAKSKLKDYNNEY